MIYLTGILTAASVFIFLMSLRKVSETNPINIRIDEHISREQPLKSLSEVWKNVLEKSPFFIRIFVPSKDLVEKSGLSLKPEIYDLIRSVTIGAALVMAVTAFFSGEYYLLFLLVLIKLPDWYLGYLAKERNRRMKREFLTVASRLATAVAGALPIDKAIEWAANTKENRKKMALKEDLNVMLYKSKVGIPLEKILDEMVEQSDIADLRRLALAVRQAKKLGIPIAETLEGMVSDARDRRMAEIIGQSKSAEQKMQIALFVMAAPSIILTLAPMILQMQGSGLV